MGKNLIFINASIMTLTSLFLRTTGIMYRSFLSDHVGTEGMGLHTLTLSVFTFAVTFSTAGINTAVTRLISEQIGRNAHLSPIPIMRKAFTYAVTVSLAVASLLFLCADFLAESILSDPRASILLKLLTPSLPFMAVSACIKGYFFALRQAAKPAVSDVIEQFAEMGVFALTIGFLAPYGTTFACTAIVIGTTLSEIASCAYLLFFYFRHRRKKNCKNPAFISDFTSKTPITALLKIAVPVAFSSGIGAGLRTVENILIPDGLRKNGISHERALSLYGMVRGMAIPVLFFPYAFLSAFSSLLIPELSEANVTGNQKRIRYISSRVIQLTTLLSILVTGIFLIFPEELGLLLYQSKEIGNIIRILAPLTVLMYADAIVDGMLKGLNLQVHVLRYNIFDSLIRIVLIAWLVPRYGFSGFMIVMYVSNIFNPVISIWKLLRTVKIRLDISNLLLKPILAVTCASLIVRCLVIVGGTDFFAAPFGLTIAIAALCFCYFILLLFMDCIKEDDILWAVQIFRQPRKERV